MKTNRTVALLNIHYVRCTEGKDWYILMCAKNDLSPRIDSRFISGFIIPHTLLHINDTKSAYYIIL
jgi:hypothetical protein